MEFLRKPFLFVVGTVAILIEETSNSIDEVRKNFNEQRDKILKPAVKTGA